MPDLSKILAIPLVALTLSTTSTVALAAWESIGGCPASSRAKLKPGDNRPLRLMAGFEGDVTVYGHLLDTVRSVNLGGITNGSASDPRGVGGFVNGGSGVVGRTGPDYCALGSLTVKVSIPGSTPRGQRGTLTVGGERIPIEVVADRFSAAWDARNNSAGLTPGTQEQIEAAANADAAAARQTCRANAETRFQQCQANRPAVEAARAQECAQRTAERDAERARREAERRASGSTGVAISNPPPIAACQGLAPCDVVRNGDLARCDDAEPRISAPRAPRCLRDLGGSSLFLPDGTLEVTMPPADRASDAQLQTCLDRGFDVRLARQRANFDFGGGQCAAGVVHQLSISGQSGSLGVRLSLPEISCNTGDAVLVVPATLRNTLISPVRGAVTLSHRAFRNTTNLRYDMGESPTPLNILVVPPHRKLEIGNPVKQAPKVGSPLIQR